MKRILTYASATILLAQLAACSKKDSSAPSSNSSIIATWQETAFTSDRPITVGNTATTEDLFSGVPSCQRYYAIFKSDGTLKGVQVSCNGDSSATYSTWKLNGTTLTLGANGSSGNVTVLKLTADSLQWTGPSYWTGPNGDTTNFIGTETFKKM